jgi:hypothetical protein
MKKCSPSLALKEMQIIITLKFHFTTLEQLGSRTPATKNVGEDSGKRNPYKTLVGM